MNGAAELDRRLSPAVSDSLYKDQRKFHLGIETRRWKHYLAALPLRDPRGIPIGAVTVAHPYEPYQQTKTAVRNKFLVGALLLGFAAIAIGIVLARKLDGELKKAQEIVVQSEKLDSVLDSFSQKPELSIVAGADHFWGGHEDEMVPQVVRHFSEHLK